MKRYFKEVKKVNAGEITPEQFVIKVFGKNYGWAEVLGAFKIYKEDEGALSWEQWKNTFKNYEAPIDTDAWVKDNVNTEE